MTWLHDVATLAVALAPVLVLLGLGWGLRRARLLSDAGSDDLNRLCYWVLLPAHLFVTIARCDLRSAFSVTALLAALIGLVVGFAAAWLLGARLPPAERGSVISGAFRANAAYIGLPVIQLACAALPAERGALMLAAYPVLLAAMVPAFNIAAVVGFLLPRHGVTRASVLGACGEVARNPLVIACLCGLAVAW
ncbi:MAG: AEC family transporter, partial [Planctomycetes bacterium]|nr:AEC family transporter [Planctomycetota bacterium]